MKIVQNIKALFLKLAAMTAPPVKYREVYCVSMEGPEDQLEKHWWLLPEMANAAYSEALRSTRWSTRPDWTISRYTLVVPDTADNHDINWAQDMAHFDQTFVPLAQRKRV